MSFRFEYARAAGDKNLFLVFAEGSFESLPFEIRLFAPWVGCDYGQMTDLKPGHRFELRRSGYAIIREAWSFGEPGTRAEPQPVVADRGPLQEAA